LGNLLQRNEVTPPSKSYLNNGSKLDKPPLYHNPSNRSYGGTSEKYSSPTSGNDFIFDPPGSIQRKYRGNNDQIQYSLEKQMQLFREKSYK
jgi:hypothetical protein